MVDEKAQLIAPNLPACRPDPADCPSGKWPVLSATKVLFVDAKASKGGNGSKAAPYKSIASAIAAATAGTTIAVTDGLYAGPLEIKKPLNLIGRCAAKVTIESKQANATIDVLGDEAAQPVVLQGLQIRSEGAGVWVTEKLAVTARRIWFHRPNVSGALVYGTGRLLLEQSVIHRVRTTADVAGSGAGVNAEKGGVAHLRQVRIEGVASWGLTVLKKGSHVEAEELAIDGTKLGDEGEPTGDGIVVQGGASIRLRGGRLAANARVALAVGGAGTQAAIEGLAIINHGRGKGLRLGLGATAGAAVIAGGVVISDGDGAAMVSQELGSVLRAGGLKVDGYRPSPPGAGAVIAMKGGRLELLGARIVKTVGTAMQCAYEQARLRLVQSFVGHGVEAPGAVGQTMGIIANSTCQLSIRDGLLWANVGYGLMVWGKGTVADARGLIVGATTMATWQDFADMPTGIEVRIDGRLRLMDARLSFNAYTGLKASTGGRVTGAGILAELGQPVVVTVAGDDGKTTWDTMAHGVMAQADGRIELAGLRNHKMFTAGVSSFGIGATLSGVGWLINHTKNSAAKGEFGIGLVAESEANATCIACEFVANRSASVLARLHATMTLRGTVIRNTYGQKYHHGLPDGSAVDLELADAVLARERAKLTLNECLLTNNPRAGILLAEEAHATVTGTASVANGYGVVIQSGAQLAGERNGWWNNSIANEVYDQDLVVPEAPVLVDE